MNDFKPRGNRFGGKPSFGGKPGFKRAGGGGFSRPQGEMHQATCAECGKSCEVPFRPNGQRPVYCRDCFGGAKTSAPGRDFPQREFAKPAFRAPTPVVSQTPDPRIDGIIRHMAKIEAKLDQVLVAMVVAKAQAGVVASEAKPKKTPKKK